MQPWRFILAVLLVVGTLLWVWSSQAQQPPYAPQPPSTYEQHDLNDPNHFYEYECCDLTHCRPALPGEVLEENGGFSVRTTGEVVPYDHPINRYGYSKHLDGRIHVCIFGAGDIPFWQPPLSINPPGMDRVRCLYIPPRGA